MNQPIKSNLHELIDTADNILLLQGPVGDFFRHFSEWLSNEHGKTVHKLNFNGGDDWFYPQTIPHTSSYRGSYDDFSTYLAGYIARHRIQAVVCFGDTRPYHILARTVAERENITFWAFEEGYLRPYFITLEKSGVNAYSPLPRDAGFFMEAYPRLPQQQYREPPAVPCGFMPVAKTAMRYYYQSNLKRKHYPNYIHHRPVQLGHYIKLWTMSACKRLNYWLEDRFMARHVKAGKYGRFFIVPLQVFNDSQVRVHCDFSSVRSFLLHVLTSFATHAPSDTHLIVKHHPMDRGFIDYEKDIRAFVKKHPSLKGRITYVHDVPLPVFLRSGAGMVTLNSTSGLSALIHNMPVKTLGRAHYDIPGLTDQAPLAEFWHNPTAPDKDIFHAYRMYHINVTQINGSFYSQVNFPKIPSKKPAILMRPSETVYVKCSAAALPAARETYSDKHDSFGKTKWHL